MKRSSTAIRRIFLIMQKEFLAEWRQRTLINGLLLYLVSTIFICYLSLNVKVNQLQPLTWNALFWIIILFAAVNAVAKSFMQEGEGRTLYYYTLFKPQELIIARILYNAVLLILLALTGFLIYSIVLGNPVQDMILFLVVIVLGSLGFSVTFTMISAIAAKASRNQTLMAVLGFPIILPVLLVVIKIARNAIDGLAFSVSQSQLITLVAINIMIGAVSYLLFPYLWRS